MAWELEVVVPVWLLAFAFKVVLSVLAKGLIQKYKGVVGLDQYDQKLWICLGIILLCCVEYLKSSISLSLWMSKLQGGRKFKSKKKSENHKRQLRNTNLSCGFFVILRFWCIGIIGINLLSCHLHELYEIKGKNLAKVLTANIFLKGNKDYIQKSSPYSAPFFQPDINNSSQVNCEYPHIQNFIVKNSIATEASFLLKTLMDPSGKPIENNSEVSLITEQLEDTILDGNEIIIHHNSEGSDNDEEHVDCELIGNFVSEGRMKIKVVEKNLKFAWDFLNADEDVKVYEIDQNYMIFNFGDNVELKEYVFSTRPWSIDGTLVILHPYNPAIVYTELDWSHQPFWIEIRDLLPEHMNQKTVTDMGKIMGKVIDIEPKEGLPKSGEYFKVCVNINITTPLRRGMLCMTAAKTTKWIGFFYKKQPSKVCKECYVLNHSRDDCKKAAATLAKIHSQVHFFSSMRGVKKNTIPNNVKLAPSMKSQLKKSPNSSRFVPPKDGIVIQGKPQSLVKEIQKDEGSDAGIVLGKRHIISEHGVNATGINFPAMGSIGSTTPLSPSTFKAIPAGSSKLPSHATAVGDKGNAKASGEHTNMES